VTTFESDRHYEEHVTDVAFWQPHIAEILTRHGLPGGQPVAGVGGTFPTFVCGDVVVKLLGHVRRASFTYEAERAAYETLTRSDAAPGLIASGQLSADWSYLVTSTMPGVAWGSAELSAEQRLSIAEELGGQIRRVHALSPIGVPADTSWPALDVVTAAGRSSLPPHLAAQAGEYVSRLGRPDRAFLHGDVTDRHVFVAEGGLTGIIDWGDAVVADRHYEIIQIYRALFDCDRELLKAFLAASEWPMTKDFPDQALGYALIRQAVGLTQHLTMDVFEPIAARFPLTEIATLNELATTLFAI
jgi:aminoglycoside phosphotransferase